MVIHRTFSPGPNGRFELSTPLSPATTTTTSSSSTATATASTPATATKSTPTTPTMSRDGKSNSFKTTSAATKKRSSPVAPALASSSASASASTPTAASAAAPSGGGSNNNNNHKGNGSVSTHNSTATTTTTTTTSQRLQRSRYAFRRAMQQKQRRIQQQQKQQQQEEEREISGEERSSISRSRSSSKDVSSPMVSRTMTSSPSTTTSTATTTTTNNNLHRSSSSIVIPAMDHTHDHTKTLQQNPSTTTTTKSSLPNDVAGGFHENDNDDIQNIHSNAPASKDRLLPYSHVQMILQVFGSNSDTTNNGTTNTANSIIDLYADVLRVSPFASDRDIRIAYFKRGREILGEKGFAAAAAVGNHHQHHNTNDNNNNNTNGPRTSLSSMSSTVSSDTYLDEETQTKFQAISMAYEILSTPGWKEEFDRYQKMSPSSLSSLSQIGNNNKMDGTNHTPSPTSVRDYPTMTMATTKRGDNNGSESTHQNGTSSSSSRPRRLFHSRQPERRIQAEIYESTTTTVATTSGGMSSRNTGGYGGGTVDRSKPLRPVSFPTPSSSRTQAGVMRGSSAHSRPSTPTVSSLRPSSFQSDDNSSHQILAQSSSSSSAWSAAARRNTTTSVVDDIVAARNSNNNNKPAVRWKDYVEEVVFANHPNEHAVSDDDDSSVDHNSDSDDDDYDDDHDHDDDYYDNDNHRRHHRNDYRDRDRYQKNHHHHAEDHEEQEDEIEHSTSMRSNVSSSTATKDETFNDSGHSSTRSSSKKKKKKKKQRQRIIIDSDELESHLLRMDSEAEKHFKTDFWDNFEESLDGLLSMVDSLGEPVPSRRALSRGGRGRPTPSVASSIVSMDNETKTSMDPVPDEYMRRSTSHSHRRRPANDSMPLSSSSSSADRQAQRQKPSEISSRSFDTAESDNKRRSLQARSSNKVPSPSERNVSATDIQRAKSFPGKNDNGDQHNDTIMSEEEPCNNQYAGLRMEEDRSVERAVVAKAVDSEITVESSSGKTHVVSLQKNTTTADASRSSSQYQETSCASKGGDIPTDKGGEPAPSLRCPDDVPNDVANDRPSQPRSFKFAGVDDHDDATLSEAPTVISRDDFSLASHNSSELDHRFKTNSPGNRTKNSSLSVSTATNTLSTNLEEAEDIFAGLDEFHLHDVARIPVRLPGSGGGGTATMSRPSLSRHSTVSTAGWSDCLSDLSESVFATTTTTSPSSTTRKPLRRGRGKKAGGGSEIGDFHSAIDMLPTIASDASVTTVGTTAVESNFFDYFMAYVTALLTECEVDGFGGSSFQKDIIGLFSGDGDDDDDDKIVDVVETREPQATDSVSAMESIA